MLSRIALAASAMAFIGAVTDLCVAATAQPTRASNGYKLQRLAFRGEPLALTANAGRLYVTSGGSRHGRITAITTTSGRVIVSRPTCGRPVGVASDANGIWVACGPDDVRLGGIARANTVLRLEPRHLRTQMSVRAPLPQTVTSAAGAIWVGTAQPSAFRIDPAHRRATLRVALSGAGPASVWSSGSQAWALTAEERGTGSILTRLARIGARARRHRLLPFQAIAILSADRRVWIVTTTGVGVLNTKTLTATTTQLPIRIGNAVAAGARLWLTSDGGRIYPFDTRSHQLGHAIRIGRSADRLTASGSTVWVADSVDQTVVSVSPR